MVIIGPEIVREHYLKEFCDNTSRSSLPLIKLGLDGECTLIRTGASPLLPFNKKSLTSNSFLDFLQNFSSIAFTGHWQREVLRFCLSAAKTLVI